MKPIVIHGGRPLRGTVRVNGAKNAALPIMAACLLCDGPSLLHRVPRLADVETIAGILRSLGLAVQWVGPDTVRIEPGPDGPVTPPAGLARQMRASICVLGPLLARRGAAAVPAPGGCVLGPRPIDLHLKGLKALGAHVHATEPFLRASAGRLRGTRLDMKGPHGSTVLGTANVMMAACLAEGRTIIQHAAREPEVQDLASFLNACGARISGAGTSTIVVDGVERLHGAEHTIIPDRIEAGTFLCAVGATGGEATLRGVQPAHMAAVIELLGRVGVEFSGTDDSITARRHGPLLPATLETAPYPGLPTDMQPQLTVLLCLARGLSSVSETVYPERFTHVPELRRMGARIVRRGSRLAIEGVNELSGTDVTAADLRAGAALVVAGLAASGTTLVSGAEQIDRGYQDLEARLRGLGAEIEREGTEAPGKSRLKSA